MAVEIVVPRIGWSMAQGTFGGWQRRDGDAVAEGDLLFVLESDKSSEDVLSCATGILRVPTGGPKRGDIVRVGQVLGYLVEQGEEMPVPPASQVARASRAQPSPPPSAPREKPAAARREDLSPGDTCAVSPRAARLAADLGIDWTKIPGSGKDGRVRERDIAAAVAARGGQIPLVEETSDVRRTIAARMARSAHEAAPVTLTREIDASVLHGMIDRGIAFTAIWAKVVAHVLLDHPPLRSAWIDGDIEVSEPSDIAVAVDTDRGIFAPVLCDVHDKSVKELDVELRRLVERIRSGSMPPNPRHGAFTITNLGSYGVDAFTPILNLPQSAILGLGRMRETAVVASGKIEMRPMMWLSLTFDHRVLDGVPAARFLDDLSKLVENPKKLRALVGL